MGGENFSSSATQSIRYRADEGNHSQRLKITRLVVVAALAELHSILELDQLTIVGLYLRLSEDDLNTSTARFIWIPVQYTNPHRYLASALGGDVSENGK